MLLYTPEGLEKFLRTLGAIVVVASIIWFIYYQGYQEGYYEAEYKYQQEIYYLEKRLK